MLTIEIPPADEAPPAFRPAPRTAHAVDAAATPTRAWLPEGAAGRTGLSLRTWRCLHIKSVGAMFEHAVFASLGDELLSPLKRAVLAFVGYAPRGCKVATGAENPGVLRIIDVLTGNVDLAVDHGWPVDVVAWSPCAPYIATASNDGVLRIVDAISGNLFFEEDLGVLGSAVVWSPRGDLLAAGGMDASIRFVQTDDWSAEALEQDSRVASLAFNQDGSKCASGTEEGVVSVVDVATRATDWSVRHAGDIWSLAFSPGGDLVASGCEDGNVRLLDARTGRLVRMVSHSCSVASVCWSPKGEQVASAGEDCMLRLVSSPTGRVKVVPHGGHVWAVAFNPAGDRLATGSSDGVLRMFDAAGQRRWEVGDLASVETLAFSPCGAVVAAGTWTGLLGLYHAETGRLACEVDHGAAVVCLAFQP